MNYNLEYLKYFYYVAKNKNITKAANQFNITQPALSKSIKNLEEQLNIKLFIRNKNGVILTKEGTILYENCEKIFSILNNMTLKINNKKTITIAIGKVLLNNILLDKIKEFNDLYPNVSINITGGTTEEIINKINNNEIDFAIGYYVNELPTNIIQEKILKPVHPIFVGGKKYEYLSKRQNNIQDIFNIPFVICSPGSTSRVYFDKILEENNIEFKNTTEVLGTTLTIDFIKNGLGIGILTKELIKNYLDNNELFEIKTNKKLPSRNIVIMYKNKLNKEDIDFLNLFNN